MRLIRGESLKQAIERFFASPEPDYRSMAFRELLTRFLDVCNVIAFAHDRGVLHRDLKPANVMLGKFGETLVVDWGLAKVLDRPLPEGATSLPTDPDDTASWIRPGSEGEGHPTLAGTTVGTPRYMSPEQAAGAHDVVGPASDVYSLGTTLYHLLTGAPPLAQVADTAEVLRRVSRGQIDSPRSLRKAIPPSLEAICQRAMDRDPGRRYPTPLALAADLQGWLADAPILGIRERFARRLTRWERRNRVLIRVAGAALMAVTLTSLVAMGLVYRARLREGQALEAERLQRTEAQGQQVAIQTRACELLLERGLELADRGETGKALLWLTRALTEVPASEPGLVRALRTAVAACQRRIAAQRAILSHGGSPVSALDLSKDGQLVATGADDGSVRLWQLATAEAHGPMLPHEGSIVALSFAPRAPRLLVATAAAAWVYDPASGAGLAGPLPAGGRIRAAAIAPDGQRIALGTEGGMVRVWDVAQARPVGPELALREPVVSLEFAPDGRLVVAGGRGGTVRVLDAQTGAGTPLEVRHPRPLEAAGFSPDGRVLLSYGGDGTARLWDVPGGEPIGPPLAHRGPIRLARFRPDGRQLLTTGLDTVVRLWDLPGGQEVVSREGSIRHQSYIPWAEFSADGRRVVTASLDRTVRLWNAASQHAEQNPMPHPGRVVQVALAADGRSLVSRDQGGGVRIWALGTDGAQGPGQPLADTVLGLAPTRDGQHYLAVVAGQGAQLRDLPTGASRGPLLAHPAGVWTVALSPDGRIAATGGLDGQARLWDLATGQPVGPPLESQREVLSVAFSPDGRRLATGSRDRSARLFDVATGAPIGPPMAHPEGVLAVRFAHDGSMLLTACEDGVVRSWHPEDQSPGTLRLVHEDSVRTLALQPGGTILATGSLAGNVRLWDLSTRRPIGAPLVHGDWVTGLAFSPDGQTLATIGTNRELRFWDVATGRRLGPAQVHPGALWAVAFTADGQSALTGGEDRIVRAWPVPAPAQDPPDQLARLARVLAGQQLDADGTYRTLADTDWQAEATAVQAARGLNRPLIPAAPTPRGRPRPQPPGAP